MMPIIAMVLPGILAGIAFGILLQRGYSARVTKISLPFMEMQINNFGKLSPVEMFNEVSMMVIPSINRNIVDAFMSIDKTPVILIHTGWSIVCESFVNRFRAYPSDDSIDAIVSEIGGQNADFIKMYRNIHLQAIRHSKSVTKEFASNYLLRAPSLAERIGGVGGRDINDFQQALIAGANGIIKGQNK
ncbi:hypothetical protein [Azospirillum thiophilum]|uniref:hypothetical protein n=1 Tax=Azospirillum thiophilum TaxID=528244 RepID=UPI0011876D91|nr:hypothetical protein [Azospirillum thiophilum]